jgi:hypothetical protein
MNETKERLGHEFSNAKIAIAHITIDAIVGLLCLKD